MSNLLKKFALTFLTFLVLFSSLAPNLLLVKAQEPPAAPAAQGTWFNQNFFSWYDKVYGEATPPSEIFGERYTAAQVQWVVYGLIALIFNMTGQADVFTCVMGNTADLSACASAIQNVFTPQEQPGGGGGSFKSMNQDKSFLAMVFDTNRPISALSYAKQKINKFDLVPEAQAQTPGFGFSALAPIQDMWRGARDIAFGLFVITAIVFAFMIMFRVKINPQTVITVQSAIPKVIGALIAVTFSYAIAGLLIDLMYVVIGIMSLALGAFSPLGDDPAGVFSYLTLGQPLGSVGITAQVTIFGFLVLVTLPFWIALIIFSVILLAAGTTGVGIVFWLLFIPIILVCLLIIWISIKTIWALFKAFANVILLTIFGPLQIALGVLIPNFGIGSWARNYFSQLSVFIVTGVLAYLSIIFTAQGMIVGFNGLPGGDQILEILLSWLFGGSQGVGGWAAGEFLTGGSPWPPLLGAGDGVWTGLLLLGVAFVLFTMIPKATELVQSFLAGKPFNYGSAIGEAFGPQWLQQAAIGGATTEAWYRAADYANRQSPPPGSFREWVQQAVIRNAQARRAYPGP